MATLEPGKIIKKKARDATSIPMEKGIRVIGSEIKNMEPAVTGIRMEMFIRDSGGKIIGTAKEPCSITMAPSIAALGKKVSNKERESSTSEMEILTMENGFVEKCMGRVLWFGKDRRWRWSGREGDCLSRFHHDCYLMLMMINILI